MPPQYLYDRLVAEFGRRNIADIELPISLTDNLNPKYELRPYQVEAFQRFICYHKNDFDFKQYPAHLLFNMATGSGKTLIMAGLILYLYDQGYRNFLFFVNSTNIIQKTRDNFLNPSSIKYLFNNEIHIHNRRVNIFPVENFEDANWSDINICFTTIQKLHSDLTNTKENSLTYEDFRKHRVALIADEAHHFNVQARNGQGEMYESWENTVERIFQQNEDNLLLEFTATHDYETPAVVQKYENKVLIRYDLLQFRNDRFSKDVVIVQSDFEQRERILQAVILNEYKQAVAAKYRINLKPVILFKAQKTIAQSQQNKADFHQLIENLTPAQVGRIRSSNIPIVQCAFRFFADNGIDDQQLCERVRHDFQPDFCLSVNDETEKDRYQILLNTLEDKDNRLRAIFAVQKLNEGWDVLNLFDIVRCYESRDTGRAVIGKTTLSEAQLIGRGARYFPFVLPSSNDRYRRKFDGDLGHELRVLEELHYHSINDSRYISEIRQALVAQGMLDEREVTREIKLKETFKKTDFYKSGIVWVNDRLPKDYRRVHSLADLGVSRRNYVHTIATGHGGAAAAFEDVQRAAVIREENRKDVKVSAMERNIVENAISRNPFYTFSSIRRYFPNVQSMCDFITGEDYLAGLEITFQGNVYNLDENLPEKLLAMSGLLNQIETEIRAEVTDYEGTREFKHNRVHQVFNDRTLKFDSANPRAVEDPQFEHFVSAKEWFAFNTIYGTSEEKAFVRMLDRQMGKLKEQYESIYLLRNEGHFAIYNFSDGQPFQPDFVLFMRERTGRLACYQLFIEPKGRHLREHDHWKEEFLQEIRQQYRDELLKLEDRRYRLIGVPFYNNEDENQFWESLESALE